MSGRAIYYLLTNYIHVKTIYIKLGGLAQVVFSI